jgi:hypothetical protein
MSASRTNVDVIKVLSSARLVAQLAEQKGLVKGEYIFRQPLKHVGAVLADAALQAGLNYNTVVKVRIDRIVREFPEAATLSGTLNAIAFVGVTGFLKWRHHTKVSRFEHLADLLRNERIDDFRQLQSWLHNPMCVEKLRTIHGVGPKTVDYLRSLVGLDFVAVDRHIKAFARDAGVVSADYDFLQTVVSYAADLLGVSRRDLDTSIWTYVTGQKGAQRTLTTLPPPFEGAVPAV